jgi:hypothetical protein
MPRINVTVSPRSTRTNRWLEDEVASLDLDESVGRVEDQAQRIASSPHRLDLSPPQPPEHHDAAIARGERSSEWRVIIPWPSCAA